MRAGRFISHSDEGSLSLHCKTHFKVWTAFEEKTANYVKLST